MRIEATVSLRELAEDIAVFLSPNDWSRDTRFDSEDGGWRQYLTGPDGAELFLSTTWARKQGVLHISGSFPAGVYRGYQASAHKINVSIDRGAKVIAAEIKRRLLPNYIAELAKVLESKHQSDNFEANKIATFKVALDVIGYAVESHNGQVREEKSVGPDYIHFRTLNEQQVQLDRFQVTVEQLRKIHAVCPELFRKDGR